MLLSQVNTDMLLLNVGFTFHNNITYIRSTFRLPYLKKGGSKKWSLRITTQILDQLRVTSTQFQVKSAKIPLQHEYWKRAIDPLIS